MPLLDVLRRFPETLRVRWMPGTRLLYTNTDYVIVAYIIERLTGSRAINASQTISCGRSA